MALIFERINQPELMLPERVSRGSNVWVFSENLAEKKIEFFKIAVRNYAVLNLEYNLFCTQLAHDLVHQHDPIIRCRQVETALALAELLLILNRDYLDVPREILRLQQEQALYQAFLKQYGYQFKALSLTPSKTPDWGIDRRAHDTTVELNWLRLMTIRSRRLLVSLAPLTGELSSYRAWIAQIDRYFNPFLLHLAWIFFTPRLLVNLTMTLKHVIPGFWMSEKEKTLGWQVRLSAQWHKRWFEFANDIAWLVSGLINCFILTGVLAPFAIYVSVALQAYDVVMASLRMVDESSRLKKLYNQYELLLKADGISDDEQKEIKAYLNQLQQKISNEQKRLWLGVINTSVLLLAITFAIPAFAFNPIIPILGAAIAVSMTIACYIATKALENNKPHMDTNPLMRNLSLLTQHGFFSSSPKEPMCILTSEPSPRIANPTPSDHTL